MFSRAKETLQSQPNLDGDILKNLGNFTTHHSSYSSYLLREFSENKMRHSASTTEQNHFFILCHLNEDNVKINMYCKERTRSCEVEIDRLNCETHPKTTQDLLQLDVLSVTGSIEINVPTNRGDYENSDPNFSTKTLQKGTPLIWMYLSAVIPAMVSDFCTSLGL